MNLIIVAIELLITTWRILKMHDDNVPFVNNKKKTSLKVTLHNEIFMSRRNLRFQLIIVQISILVSEEKIKKNLIRCLKILILLL